MADTVRTVDDFLNASTGLLKDNTAGDISAQDLRDYVVSAIAQWPLNNFLINGGGDYFQRQDPATLTSRSDDAYAGDRWYVLTQTAAIQTQRTTGDTASKYAHRLKQNQASAQRMGYAQIVESVGSQPLRSRAVRFQARVKCSASQAIRIAILEWTGTADSVTSDVVNDWTSGTYTAGNFFNSTTLTVTAVSSVTPSVDTWTDISVTGTLGASVNNIVVFIWTEGTAAQNVTLDITEAGLYDGTAARAWLPRPTAAEQALCYRYCFTLVNAAYVGSRYATADIFQYVTFPVEMRTTPTLSTTLTGFVSGTSPAATEVAGYDLSGDAGITITGALSVSLVFAGSVSGRIGYTAGTSFTGSSGAISQVRLGTDGRIILSAEL